jgi:hypothetical protein
MTQRHISHPEGLPACAAGHSARHILDLRGAAAGGGHFVECCCRHTTRHADFDAALSAWKRMNRPPRAARKTIATHAETADNVLQMPLHFAARATQAAKGVRRVGG